MNTPDQSNYPGARSGSVGWIDSNDIMYLFGGIGYDKNSNQGFCLEQLFNLTTKVG